ncbi:MAG: hypothetical protein [Olavius algarvensis Gamma 1 endosymbiont]|nr:MAG: hypothetical protein [Olavius algarvensis Gamma 1 endosymbiont]
MKFINIRELSTGTSLININNPNPCSADLPNPLSTRFPC